MPVIRLQNVEKLYKGSGRKWPALLGLDLTIGQGEFVCFAGRRGCGSSTALSLICGDVLPDKGCVKLGKTDFTNASRRRQKRLEECFGKMPQAPGLEPGETTVFDSFCPANRAQALKISIVDRPLIKKALALVGLEGAEWQKLEEFTPTQLRRIEFAGAILRSPPILIIDDIAPTVDDETLWDLVHLLRELNRRGTTIIMAAHSGKIINILRPRVITLADGKVISDENPGKFGETVTL